MIKVDTIVEAKPPFNNPILSYGTVVHIHPDHKTAEVEFSNDEGLSIGVFPLAISDLVPRTV